MLNLGYPGGPLISKRAETGDRKKYNFPIPNLGKNSLDLSFSGVKSAVRRLIELEENEKGLLSDKFINDVCASFEETCGRIFLKKFQTVLERYPEVKSFYFVGGVSANKYLNKVFSVFMHKYGINLKTPVKIEYSTDNAAMIGAAAYWQMQSEQKSKAAVQYIEALPRLQL